MTQTESTQIETYKTNEEKHSNFLYKQAEVLANTDIVPSHLRGKPGQIFAVVSIGDTLGLAPATAVQSFASINGQVTMSAELMRALILREGHSISFLETTREVCKIRGKRKETGDECTVEYTLEDAQIAGLCGIKDGKAYSRSKSGQPLAWEKYPRQLLAARATTELARLLFADLIKGVSYTPEEIGGDYIEEDNKISFAVENLAIEGQPIDIQTSPEDYLDEAFEDPIGQIDEIIESTNGEPKITQPQMKRAFAILNELPEQTRAAAEAGRKIMFGENKSRRDYTEDEADRWIQYLLSLKEEPDNG